MLLRDIVYAARLLWKRPGFTVVAVVTLALGIGANTVVFSVVNGVLLKSLPYEEADRLVVLWDRQMVSHLEQQPVAPATLEDWKAQSRVFEGLAALRGATFNLTTGGETERVTGARVATNFYSLLRTRPVLGRDFIEDDGRPGAQSVALISQGLWQRRFGSDPQIVGKSLRVDGNAYTVVGVMPSGLDYPAPDTDLVVPFIPTAGELLRANHFVRVLGRLRPGVTLAQARAEMDTIATRLEQQYPDTNTGYRVQIVPLYEQLVGSIRPALLLLLVAVGLVLLIACANVANLLLARAETRRMELAVRTALGASRVRLVRQLLTESVMLSLCGGLLGFLLAFWGLPALARLGAGSIPRAQEITISYSMLGFTLLVSLAAGLLFGVVPALQSSSRRMTTALRDGRRGSTAGPLHRRVLGVLVVSEVALALMLLVGAGLMVRSFLSLRGVSPGYDPKGKLTAGIGLSPAKYPELRQQAAFYQDLLARLESVPGVASVAIVSKLPVVGFSTSDFTIQGSPVEPGHEPGADYRVISPRYFETMGIPFVKGRDFDARDKQDAPDAVIVNRATAERFWPGGDPLGKRIQLSAETTRWREIVGVVGNEKLSGLDTETGPAIYGPLPQNSFPNALRSVVIIARSGGDDPASLAPAIQREARAMDLEQALFQVRPLEDVISNSLAQRRFNGLLMIVFAALAALLAAIGIYGVMAYSVTQRTHEIGVRLALGARPLDVMRMVLGQGLRLTLAGVGIGVAASAALTRVLSTLLYGVSATDAGTFVFVPLLLTATAMLASYVPARRATRVDPCVALRLD